MKLIPAIFILLIAAFKSTLYAQGIATSGAYELMGTVAYSYSNNSGPPDYMQSYDRYSKTHQVEFQPSIGYFFSDEWEVSSQPLFTFSSSKYNYTTNVSDASGSRLQEGRASSQSYRVGISVGLFFHLRLSENVVSFVGTTAGLSWEKLNYLFTTEGVPDLDMSSPWSKATIEYPNFTVGLKLFVRENWALAPQVDVTYKSLATTSVFPGSYDKQLRVALGIGLAVYLNHKNGG